MRLGNLRSDQLNPERTRTNISYNQLTDGASESETKSEGHTEGLLTSFNSTISPNTTTTQQSQTHPTSTQPTRPTNSTTQTYRNPRPQTNQLVTNVSNTNEQEPDTSPKPKSNKHGSRDAQIQKGHQHFQGRQGRICQTELTVMKIWRTTKGGRTTTRD